MTTKIPNKISTEFSMPKATGDPVIVNCIMPDGTKKQVGYIYQNFSDGEDLMVYISTDNEGEQVFPPTTDWPDLEDKFERYSKKVIDEARIASYLEYEERQSKIKNVRISKNAHSKSKEINF
ncbi:MAG: hypothetical protein WC223_13435 [Bacteroidales bacterium]|jgi:hypothetical protein